MGYKCIALLVLKNLRQSFHSVINDADKTSEAKTKCPDLFVVVGINDYLEYITQ